MKKVFKTLALLVFIAACKSTSTTTKKVEAPQIICNKMLVTYNSHIKQIIDDNCANTCHSEKNHSHGIDLSSYEKVKIASVKPSFLGSINHTSGFDAMPPNKAKLDDAIINKITCWIQNGSPN